jgi:hypothetical protein
LLQGGPPRAHQIADGLLDDHARAARGARAQVLGDGLTLDARKLPVDIRGEKRIDGRAIRHWQVSDG